MAFDLDDEELEATRKMHKGSNINVGSIEEDIKILKNYLKNSAYKESNSDFFKNGGWEIVDLEVPQALEHLLQDYTRQKHINEEHQMINGELREKVKALEAENEATRKVIVEQCDFIQNFSIPKQKIKDKIEELKNEKNRRVQLGIFILKDYENQHLLGEISSLQELLEESENE